MKTKFQKPRIETLECRALLSASPLGDLAAPSPEPDELLLPAVQKVRAAAARMMFAEQDGGTAGMLLLPAVQKVRAAEDRISTTASDQTADLVFSAEVDQEETGVSPAPGSAGKVSTSDLNFAPSNDSTAFQPRPHSYDLKTPTKV